MSNWPLAFPLHFLVSCLQITELVHQRDITRQLVAEKVASPKSFAWLAQMRFYFDPKNPEPLLQLSIQMANARFNYGFEYLGVQEKLVQTPLTDRCYLTMTQALEARLGGSPFGKKTSVVYFIKEVNPSLAKPLLTLNGGLAKLWLTFLAK